MSLVSSELILQRLIQYLLPVFLCVHKLHTTQMYINVLDKSNTKTKKFNFSIFEILAVYKNGFAIFHFIQSC